MSPQIEKLLQVIEQKLGWGAGAHWQARDFDRLNELILEQTGISLSASTLRRIWGRVAYTHLPSATTLDALARFAGYESWREFLKQQDSQEKTAAPALSRPSGFTRRARSVKLMIGIVTAVLLTGAALMLAFKKSRPENKALRANEYSFSSRIVTRGLPNSVIFTYDAAHAPTDSVFIQQSWDPRTRSAVDKHLHQHTSIYYEPGLYQAKLMVGSQVVKEHPLLIATNGWTGIFTNNPVPVYIDTANFLKKDMMELPLSWVRQRAPALESQPSYIKYLNVGNFDPVSVRGFSFHAEVKNEYRAGAAACQLTYVLLVTDAMPIVIPLSAKGCVAELSFYAADHFVSGKTSDLSGFGVDFSGWAKLSCRSASNMLQYYVNEKLAYECPLPAKPVNIVGMGFIFQGTGAVRHISLDNEKGPVYHDF